MYGLVIPVSTCAEEIENMDGKAHCLQPDTKKKPLSANRFCRDLIQKKLIFVHFKTSMRSVSLPHSVNKVILQSVEWG